MPGSFRVFTESIGHLGDVGEKHTSGASLAGLDRMRGGSVLLEAVPFQLLWTYISIILESLWIGTKVYLSFD